MKGIQENLHEYLPLHKRKNITDGRTTRSIDKKAREILAYFVLSIKKITPYGTVVASLSATSRHASADGSSHRSISDEGPLPCYATWLTKFNAIERGRERRVSPTGRASPKI
jgi:hypothetical protein